MALPGALGRWPDGGRLPYPAGPGARPAPPEGSAPYDVAFLDLLGDPAQLGWLRARGLITADTVTAVAFADHRVPSEAELARRCGFWRVRLAGDGEAIDPARSVPKDRDVAGGTRRVLVLGGARSGKSERAELRLAGAPAGLVADGGDHRPGRPARPRPRGAADRRDRHLAGRGPRRVRLGAAGRRGAGQAGRPPGRTDRRVAADPLPRGREIGRASCRERV